MSSLWTGQPTGSPRRRAGEVALRLLAIPLAVVSAGFTFYVTLLEVPGGLASWSITVLGFSLWLWPIMPLARRWRWGRTTYELTASHARALHSGNQAILKEYARAQWPGLSLAQETNGTWTAWPTNDHGSRSADPIFEGVQDPEPLRRALSGAATDEAPPTQDP